MTEREITVRVCRQKDCVNPAICRFTWPGRNESYICAKHLPALLNIADAMGMHLQVLPLAAAESARAETVLKAGDFCPRCNDGRNKLVDIAEEYKAKQHKGSLHCPNCEVIIPARAETGGQR